MRIGYTIINFLEELDNITSERICNDCKYAYISISKEFIRMSCKYDGHYVDLQSCFVENTYLIRLKLEELVTINGVKL